MTGADQGSLRLVALVCPTCGGDLDGLASDRVFGCRPCSRAYSLEPEGPAAAEIVRWEPEGPRACVFLPVWEFEVDAVVVLPPRARASRPPGEDAAADRIIPFDGRRVYVTACDLRGRGRFGDPGLHFTRRRPEPRVGAAGAPPRLAGAVLSRRTAAAVVPSTILAVVDVVTDVHGGRVDARIGSSTLVMAPFAVAEDGSVTEPFGGVAYPRAAFPDLDSILAEQSRHTP